MLTAYLEDRPFYLFDEWASDQDPQFKKVFYDQLLPELKARGKSVLVITHDDRYFHLADRVIKLDYGRIVYQSDMASAKSDHRATNVVPSSLAQPIRAVGIGAPEPSLAAAEVLREA